VIGNTGLVLRQGQPLAQVRQFGPDLLPSHRITRARALQPLEPFPVQGEFRGDTMERGLEAAQVEFALEVHDRVSDGPRRATRARDIL
jgi:hypothetical protein